MSEPDNKQKQPENRGTLKAIVNFSQIGVTMAASVLIGVFLGKFIDGLCGTSPVFLLIFSLLGVGAAFKAVFNSTKDK